jgi:hypothetical protein
MITLEALLSKWASPFSSLAGRPPLSIAEERLQRKQQELLIYNIYKMCLNLDTCY